MQRLRQLRRLRLLRVTAATVKMSANDVHSTRSVRPGRTYCTDRTARATGVSTDAMQATELLQSLRPAVYGTGDMGNNHANVCTNVRALSRGVQCLFRGIIWTIFTVVVP